MGKLKGGGKEKVKYRKDRRMVNEGTEEKKGKEGLEECKYECECDRGMSVWYRKSTFC